MASNDNNNRGAMWKVEHRKSDKHPNLNGKATIDGKEYYVSGWTNNEGGKKPIVSLAFTPVVKNEFTPEAVSSEEIPF